MIMVHMVPRDEIWAMRHHPVLIYVGEPGLVPSRLCTILFDSSVRSRSSCDDLSARSFGSAADHILNAHDRRLCGVDQMSISATLPNRFRQMKATTDHHDCMASQVVTLSSTLAFRVIYEEALTSSHSTDKPPSLGVTVGSPLPIVTVTSTPELGTPVKVHCGRQRGTFTLMIPLLGPDKTVPSSSWCTRRSYHRSLVSKHQR